MERQIIDCIQGSDEWYEARLGLVTASRFKDVLSNGSGRKTYMMKLLAERDTGVPQETYKNEAMEMGNETESFAREHYEKATGVKVEQVGFIKWGEIGASPDGLVGDDGCIEIKCPYNSTHLGYIIKKKLPSTYNAQVQGLLWVCERKWCDFISYAPMCKRPMWKIRVERDEPYIEALDITVREFLDELHALKEIVNMPF